MSRRPRSPRPPRTGLRRIARPLVAVPVVLALLAGAGVWALLRDDGEPTATDDGAGTEQLVEVTVGDIDQTIPAEGTIEAETTTDEAFAASGTVTEVLVAAGDEVAAGAPLARIDSSELEAAVVTAQASLDDAEATLAEATDGDASDTEVAARQAQVDAATTDLVAAVEDLAGATLTSPVDGTVAVVGYEVGDVLGADGTDGTDLTGSDTGSGTDPSDDDQGDGAATEGIQVISTGTYLVTIDVDATEVDQIEEGQTALVTPTTSSSSSGSSGGPGGFGPGGGPMMMTDGIPQERSDALAAAGETADPEAAGAQVEGTVTSVGAVASAESGVATFPVEITVEGSPDEFFPGAVAQIEVVHDRITDAVTVPAMAVRQVDGQATVTVADGDEREERVITTGVTSGASVQVVEGLEAGEQVVVTRPAFMGGPQGADGGDGGGPVLQEGGR